MTTVFCPKCASDFTIADRAATKSAVCPCGNLVSLPSSAPTDMPASFLFDDDDQSDDSGTSPVPRDIWRSRGSSLAESYGMTSFTFSLTALFVCFCGSIWLGLLAGVVAVVFGILSLRHRGRWWGIAGLIVGGLVVVFAALVIGLAAVIAFRK